MKTSERLEGNTKDNVPQRLGDALGGGHSKLAIVEQGNQQWLNSCGQFCSKDSSPSFGAGHVVERDGVGTVGSGGRRSGAQEISCGEGRCAFARTRRDDGQLGI
jgi:hypothetical protein